MPPRGYQHLERGGPGGRLPPWGVDKAWLWASALPVSFQGAGPSLRRGEGKVAPSNTPTPVPEQVGGFRDSSSLGPELPSEAGVLGPEAMGRGKHIPVPWGSPAAGTHTSPPPRLREMLMAAGFFLVSFFFKFCYCKIPAMTTSRLLPARAAEPTLRGRPGTLVQDGVRTEEVLPSHGGVRCSPAWDRSCCWPSSPWGKKKGKKSGSPPCPWWEGAPVLKLQLRFHFQAHGWGFIW